MKKLILAAAFAMTLAVAANAQTTTPATTEKEPKGVVNKRIENQKDRINQGVKSGELTKGEAKTLKTEEKGLKAEVKTERKANGGKLNAQERKDVKKQLNSESKQIYKDKHNEKERPAAKKNR